MTTLITTLLLAALVSGAPPPPQARDALPAIEEGRWNDALPILEEVAAANPCDGRARLYLGYTYQHIGRHREAIAELSAALGLGVTGNRRGMQVAHVSLARSLTAVGETDEALDQLEEAWSRWGFDDFGDIVADEDFAALRADPRLRELAGLDTRADAGDRDARWHANLRYLRRLVTVTHPDPFHAIAAADWNAAADSLDQEIGSLSDREVAARFMELVARIGDGHTAVYPPTEGDLAWHLLPFFPVCMEDGWFVAAAAPEYTDLVGGRIVEAAGRDWSDIFAFVAAHVARDNTFTRRWLAAVGLQFAELYGLAAGREDVTQVEVVVERSDGKRVRANITSTPVTRNPNSHWAPEDWVTAYETAPLWLSNPADVFHHETLPGSEIVYARVLQTADSEEQSLAEYGRELREFFTGSGASALILDLRLNNGGNAYQGQGFVDELIRTPGLGERGRLFVLIGPRSFSATGYLLGAMQKHFDPVFVGWPSGCRPVGYSSERPFRLPYSGLTGSISCELRVDGYSTDDVRPSFYPDVLVWPSGEDLLGSRDPVLETVVNALRSGS